MCKPDIRRFITINRTVKDLVPPYRNIVRALSIAGRAALYLSPLVAAICGLEIMLWTTGDSWPARKVVARQFASASEIIYGRRNFANQLNVYKSEGIRQKRPAILITGSSRVMQIRDFMFHPVEELFYNAGGMLRDAYDVLALAEEISAGDLPPPAVLIIGIDPWWIKEQDNTGAWLQRPDEVFSVPAHVAALRRLIGKNLFNTPLLSSTTPFYEREAIGSMAVQEGSGFRRDGSFQYSPRLFEQFVKNPTYIDREEPPIIERVISMQDEFAAPAIVDTARVRMVIEGLVTLRMIGIEVYAFMPPFSLEVWQALEQSEPLDAWWRFYRFSFVELLEHFDIPVIPSAAPADFGLDETYMIDGCHPSEVFMGHVMRSIIQAAPAGSFLDYVDKERLLRRIMEAPLPLTFNLPGKLRERLRIVRRTL